jgi:peroxiredoxin
MSGIRSVCPDWQISQWFNTQDPLSPQQLRGEVVVLHFFQMLCPGCVAHALPQAQMVHRMYGEAGVRVVGIHSVFEHHEVMTPAALDAFIHEYKLTFPIGVDQPAASGCIPITMQRYQLRGTPSLVLIDRQGSIRQHVFGRVEDLDLGFALGTLLAEQELPAEFAGNRPSPTAQSGCDDDSCPSPAEVPV